MSEQNFNQELVYVIPRAESRRAIKLLNRLIERTTDDGESPISYENWKVLEGEAFKIQYDMHIDSKFLPIARVISQLDKNKKRTNRHTVELLHETNTTYDDVKELFSHEDFGAIRCDVCGRPAKNRSTMYLILDSETGEYLRVGSGCVETLSGDAKTLTLINKYFEAINDLKLFFDEHKKTTSDPNIGVTEEYLHELYDEEKIEEKTGFSYYNIKQTINRSRETPGSDAYNLRQLLMNKTYRVSQRGLLKKAYLNYVGVAKQHKEDIRQRNAETRKQNQFVKTLEQDATRVQEDKNLSLDRDVRIALDSIKNGKNGWPQALAKLIDKEVIVLDATKVIGRDPNNLFGFVRDKEQVIYVLPLKNNIFGPNAPVLNLDDVNVANKVIRFNKKGQTIEQALQLVKTKLYDEILKTSLSGRDIAIVGDVNDKKQINKAIANKLYTLAAESLMKSVKNK